MWQVNKQSVFIKWWNYNFDDFWLLLSVFMFEDFSSICRILCFNANYCDIYKFQNILNWHRKSCTTYTVKDYFASTRICKTRLWLCLSKYTLPRNNTLSGLVLKNTNLYVKLSIIYLQALGITSPLCKVNGIIEDESLKREVTLQICNMTL